MSSFTIASLCFCVLLSLAFAQAPRDNARQRPQALQLQAVQPGGFVEEQRVTVRCSPLFRQLDGVCTNPVFKLWGSTGRAQSSLFFTQSSITPTGKGLPSARYISNAVCKQSSDVFNKRNLNELVVFFGQFVDHTFVATPASSEKMPIPIPKNDPIFANFSGGVLQFSRSQRAKVDILGIFGSSSDEVAKDIPSIVQQDPGLASKVPGVTAESLSQAPKVAVSAARAAPSLQQVFRQVSTKESSPSFKPGRASIYYGAERPINSLSSALDLATVYGPDVERNNALRSFQHGKLKVSAGNLMPLNTAGLSNAPTADAFYFLAGDHRANEHPVLTALHTIFVREHNRICDELKRVFFFLGDKYLYELAKLINIAQFQKIVFEEYYPAMVGKRLPPYTGFKYYKNVAIIDVFSTAAFRVGHTMVGNKISRAGKGNIALKPLSFMEMFFRTAKQFTNVEEFLRGAAITKAQEVDVMIHDSLRNFLFTGVPEEGLAFDLVSLNLQRGRDHALPPLNAIRKRLGLPAHRTFSDITKNANVASSLSTVYGGNVNKVEAWVGMVAEDHVHGGSLGSTMAAMWERQFRNLRDGDRFYYKNDRFPRWLKRIPTVRRLFSGRSGLKDIILKNSDITRNELRGKVFFHTR